MRRIATTRCCSAIVLAIAAWASLIASAADTPFFPVRSVWTLPLRDRPNAPPAFRDGLGYVPTAGTHLTALDLIAGRELWVVDADVRSKPAVGETLLFTDEPGAVVARNASDGSTVWRVPVDEPLAAPLVWENGWLIAGTTSGTILTFRASDGHLFWQRRLDSTLHASPVLAADRVYLPVSNGRVVALLLETGAPVWERRLGGPPSDLLAFDDRLYVGSIDNYFYCLIAQTGMVAWRYPTGGDVIGLPFVHDRLVYFVSLDNALRALDWRSGSQRWRRPLPLRPTRGPLPLANAVVVSGSGAALYAYTLKDGQPAGDLPAPSAVTGTHVVPDPLRLIVVTDDLIKGAAITAIGRQGDPAPAASLWNRGQEVGRGADGALASMRSMLSAWRR